MRLLFKRTTRQKTVIVSAAVSAILFTVNSYAQAYKFDFGVASVPAVTGYTKATTANLYTIPYANDNTICKI